MEKIFSKRCPLNAKRGFTLIELIVVMTIILILAGLITGAATKAKQRALVAQAKTMIAGLETALGMFQSDIGRYPGSNFLYTDLTASSGGDLTAAEAANWAGPYMNFKQGDVSGANILDSWNRAYTYNNPGANHSATGGPNYTNYFDIWSNGPDGASGNADDVTNWTR